MPLISRTSAQLELAREQMGGCALCEHRCGANRLAGERGPCKAGHEARVFRQRVECGEEAELIPSHLFYLSGCDLRCAFCIAEANAFDPARGRLLTRDFFSAAVTWGKTQGARNVQWVGGEPTIHIPAILDVMSDHHDLPPIVWKSDFYGTPAAFELLDGFISVYLADFKFGNDACASRIARVPNYVSIVTRNLQIATDQADLIVRHLLLPGHFECCYLPIVEWLKEHLPRVKFSLRDGYLPRWQAGRMSELAVALPRDAGLRAREHALDRGLNVIS
jgi:putative pyruvate formate lyase activating enzyme